MDAHQPRFNVRRQQKIANVAHSYTPVKIAQQLLLKCMVETPKRSENSEIMIKFTDLEGFPVQVQVRFRFEPIFELNLATTTQKTSRPCRFINPLMSPMMASPFSPRESLLDL
jgi:hypothetical protein